MPRDEQSTSLVMPESVAAVAIAACISIVLIGHCCAKVQDPHQFTEDAHWDGLGQCVKLAVANSGKVAHSYE